MTQKYTLLTNLTIMVCAIWYNLHMPNWGTNRKVYSLLIVCFTETVTV